MGRRWAMGRWGLSGRGREPEGVEFPGSEPRAPGRTAEPANAASSALRGTAGELGAVLEASQGEIERLAGDFEAMAQAAQGMVEGAAAIVGCSAGERVQQVLTDVHRLGAATRDFLRQRLESTAGIVETVAAEADLLARLAGQTQAQKAIVRETAMLRVLTNIEVARLGEVGAGFEYLARELDDFATAVAESIGTLNAHTEERRAEMEATRRTLTAELPRLRGESAELERALERAQAEADATLAELQATPSRFQGCVDEIAQRIAGMVAAIQANDITRQQMEHVRAALGEIAEELEAGGGPGVGAGLAIQSYQVRSIRTTVEGWTGQIRRCLDAIAQLAAEEILELGRGVLGRERELEGELARIEQVEERCAADNAKVQASFAGVAGLMLLVSEHLERSRAVRERLRLLMFNSIVEASHLGAQADGILEISNTIKRLSGEWSHLTQESERAMQEIRALVERNEATMEAFCAGAQEALRAAREQMRSGLAILRDAAGCAEGRGRQIQEEAGVLEGRVAEVRRAGDRLERCLARLGDVLEGIEAARPAAAAAAEAEVWDRAAMEERFGSSYTTEMERRVLRAALEGAPLPAAGESLGGNGVELF